MKHARFSAITIMTILSLALLSFLAVFSQISLAVADEVADEIIVSATGMPTPAERLGASVDVISGDMLRRRQVTQLQGALAELAGVSVYRSGGTGGQSNVFLRGMAGKYGAVLVDGIQINDPVSQQAAWPHLNVTGVGAVELLRGSHSVLYGSEAVGGVVNLRTMIGEETPSLARLEAGRYGTQQLNLSSGGSAGIYDYGAALLHHETDGISHADARNGNTEADGYRATSGNFHARATLSDSLSVNAALRVTDSRVETDNMVPADSVGTYTQHDSMAYRLGVESGDESAQHSFSLTGMADENATESGFGLSRFEGGRNVFAYRSVLAMSPDTRILFGAEHETESYEGSGADYDVSTLAGLALVQHRFHAKLSGSLAVRLDEHEKFGGFETYRASGLWQVTDTMAMRGNIGTGYRAPSLYELFGASIYCVGGICGNAGLAPEESDSLDVGLVVTPYDNLSIDIAPFRIKISNLIVYDQIVPANGNDACLAANSFGVFQATTCGRYMQSSGASTNEGLEVRVKWRSGDGFMADLNHSYLDARDENDNRAIRRPRHVTNLRLAQRFGERFDMSLGVQHVHDALDTDFASFSDVPLADYTLVNLAVAYALAGDRQLTARVENALDEHYQTVLGYGTPGRAFYIGLQQRF